MDVDKKEKEAVYGEMDFHFSNKGGDDDAANTFQYHRTAVALDYILRGR